MRQLTPDEHEEYCAAFGRLFDLYMKESKAASVRLRCDSLRRHLRRYKAMTKELNLVFDCGKVYKGPEQLELRPLVVQDNYEIHA